MDGIQFPLAVPFKVGGLPLHSQYCPQKHPAPAEKAAVKWRDTLVRAYRRLRLVLCAAPRKEAITVAFGRDSGHKGLLFHPWLGGQRRGYIMKIRTSSR